MRKLLSNTFMSIPGLNHFDQIDRIKNPLRESSLVKEAKLKIAAAESISEICSIALEYSRKLK